MLTLETLKHNDGLRRLNDVLASEHWDGKNNKGVLTSPTTEFVKCFETFQEFECRNDLGAEM